MSFFKDFKDDLSTAVDEMMPGAEQTTPENYLEESAMAANEERLEEMARELEQTTAEPVVAPSVSYSQRDLEVASTPVSNVTDENAVITEGMTITGNVESTGSVEVRGTVLGDVKCNGKLVVTGMIQGNTESSEFFADNARVSGEINAAGTVKVGHGSVIVGNITSTSAVVAGAVKGDIDVHGPVVVDTSAVVMGNIKSRSVQINNGAVIEGFCSQCYAEIDVQGIFG